MEFKADPEHTAAVDAATDALEQGDVVMLPAGTLVVRPTIPLSNLALPIGVVADALSSRLYELPYGGMIASQTCELVRASAKHPFATVAPIVGLQKPDQKFASDWRMTRYVPLPFVGDGMFADLSLCFAIEKSVLLNSHVARQQLPDDDRRKLGHHIGRFFGRPALPDDVVKAIGAFSKIFRTAGPRTPEGLARDTVWMIRLIPLSKWSDDPLRFHIFFCVESEKDLAVVTEQQWLDAVDEWVETIDITNRISGVTAEITSLERLSAYEWLHSDEHDLAS